MDSRKLQKLPIYIWLFYEVISKYAIYRRTLEQDLMNSELEKFLKESSCGLIQNAHALTHIHTNTHWPQRTHEIHKNLRIPGVPIENSIRYLSFTILKPHLYVRLDSISQIQVSNPGNRSAAHWTSNFDTTPKS
jgi:hypothetical protein